MLHRLGATGSSLGVHSCPSENSNYMFFKFFTLFFINKDTVKLYMFYRSQNVSIKIIANKERLKYKDIEIQKILVID